MSRITFTIPDEKLDEFLKAFVLAEPMPSTMDGPQLTPRQWYKKWVKLKSQQAYEKGRRKMATIQIDKGIIK